MNFNEEGLKEIVGMGNWLSNTNVRLRKAVYDFINEVYNLMDAEDFFSEEIDWAFRKIEKNGEEFVRASFRRGEAKTNKWVYVDVGKETHMSNIVAFSEALVGPEGQRLLNCMKGETQKRSDFQRAISLGLVVMQAKAHELGIR